MKRGSVFVTLVAGVVACGSGSDPSATASADAGAVTHVDGSLATTPGADGGDGLPSDAAGVGDAPTSLRDGGITRSVCKRGIASNATPTSAFSHTPSMPGVSWWYDWSNQPTSAPAAGIDFVPMIWGPASLAGPLPSGASYVLGFNEPNFKAQSNLTPQEAATDWPMVEALAHAQGIPLVSPAVNYCGSASNSSGCSDPSVTDPYTWLKDFLTACPGCEVDAIAIHWYNCDLPSLQAYIEGNVDAGGGLEGFVQFGKPIWLTEFACDGTHSAADQKTYMQAALPYLESNPHVARYSWFSSSAIASAVLANADGSLTDLGSTYVSLAQSCP